MFVAFSLCRRIIGEILMAPSLPVIFISLSGDRLVVTNSTLSGLESIQSGLAR